MLENFQVVTMGFIRYRLLTVLIIGVITSALSLIALARVLSITAGQRRERGYEAVQKELDRLSTVGSGPTGLREVLASPPAMGLIGMRAGFWEGKNALDAAFDSQRGFSDLPPEWRPPLSRALGDSLSKRARVLLEQPCSDGLLLLGVQPASLSSLFWVGYLVPPPRLWHFWITIVILLAVATGLLVTSAVGAVVSFTRSANALDRCLRGLAEDLSTPVPRPRIRELAEVADGISTLAQRLLQAREEQQRLGRELGEKERLAALGRVVAGVAHEVRNPLASIKLRLDLAAAGDKLPMTVVQAIGHASAEIARLDRLVADLLVVSGRQMGPRISSSLGDLLRARADALAPWADSRGVNIRVEGEAQATIDAESVARAVDNLLRNAVEASPVGATVLASVHERDGLLRLRVEDRGPGVRRSTELFEPFFTTKPDGTGLGLAISRAIARAHGGDVTYTRSERDGEAFSCFELSLLPVPVSSLEVSI